MAFLLMGILSDSSEWQILFENLFAGYQINCDFVFALQSCNFRNCSPCEADSDNQSFRLPLSRQNPHKVVNDRSSYTIHLFYLYGMMLQKSKAVNTHICDLARAVTTLDGINGPCLKLLPT